MKMVRGPGDEVIKPNVIPRIGNVEFILKNQQYSVARLREVTGLRQNVRGAQSGMGAQVKRAEAGLSFDDAGI